MENEGKAAIQPLGAVKNVAKSDIPAEGVAKATKTARPVNVLASMSSETVLDLDSKGTELLFGQKEDFLVLDETTIRALSRENRIRYSSARQFHDNWRGQEDADFVEAFEVDREFAGSASDKLYKINVRDGLKYRWARPDKVADYQAKGYKMLSPDDAKSFLGAKGSRHEISRNGKTELVLMGVSQTIFDKRQADKGKKNKERALAWKSSGVEQLRAQGGSGFVDETGTSTGNNFQEMT